MQLLRTADDDFRTIPIPTRLRCQVRSSEGGRSGSPSPAHAPPCRRSRCRQAISMGLTIGIRSAHRRVGLRPCRSNGKPRMDPGSKPKVLSTPRICFDSRVVMPTSCARAPRRARARCASGLRVRPFRATMSFGTLDAGQENGAAKDARAT